MEAGTREGHGVDMWEKGQSGNPGGKPRTHKKLQELLALKIQKETGGPALLYFSRKLWEFMEFGDSHKVKFAALVKAMEYMIGKPHQMIEINHTVDIAERLRKARERSGLPALIEPLVVPDTDDETTDPI